MTWFKVDDGFHDHKKVRRLGKDRTAAVGVWTLCGSWSADTGADGFVPTEIVQRHDPREKLAARLVDVGLWHRDEVDGEPGYRFHDWHDYQPTADEVEEKRAKRAAAGRLGGLRSGQSRRSKTEANASASATAFAQADTEANAKQKRTPSRKRTTTQVPTQGAGNVTREHTRDAEPIPTGPGITGPTAVSAKHLVQRHIGTDITASTRTALAIEVGQLINHYPETVLVEALTRWKARTGIGPKVLPGIVDDIVKEQAGVNAYNVRSSGSGARSARSDKVAAILAAGDAVQAELDAGALEGQSFRVIEGGRSA